MYKNSISPHNKIILRIIYIRDLELLSNWSKLIQKFSKISPIFDDPRVSHATPFYTLSVNDVVIKKTTEKNAV